MNQKNNSDKIKMQGVVKEIFPGGTYSVLLENEMKITCRVSGKMRQHRISILLGDKVDVELSVYDLSNGRIVYRYV